MWSFSVSELAIPGAEIGRISATDADLGENAKLEYTILEGESGDTFNITGVNQEAVITLNKVRGHWRGDKKGQSQCQSRANRAALGECRAEAPTADLELNKCFIISVL